MKILISGGAKSGKSDLGEDLAALQRKTGQTLFYLATLKPADEEDHDRVRNHQHKRKGKGFVTLDYPFNLGQAVKDFLPTDSVLLDSVTALLGNEMFGYSDGIHDDGEERLREELTVLLQGTENLVIVTDDIFSSPLAYDAVTEQFRKSLAKLSLALAEQCDVVLEVNYGLVKCHKGKEAYEKLSQRLYCLPWYV